MASQTPNSACSPTLSSERAVAQRFLRVLDLRCNWYFPCCTISDMARNQVLGVAVEKLAKAGERAGLSVHDLITLLDSGMTMEQLLDYLQAKLSNRSVEN